MGAYNSLYDNRCSKEIKQVLFRLKKIFLVIKWFVKISV